MKPDRPRADSARDLETLLRLPVADAPPTDSSVFAGRVLREALREDPPRRAAAPSWSAFLPAAAAALALLAGLVLLTRPGAKSAPAARVSPPDVPAAAAALPGVIENAVRHPYNRELALLREDFDRTTRFVVRCAGFELTGAD